MKNEVLNCIIPLLDYKVTCFIGWDIEDFKNYTKKELDLQIDINKEIDGVCIEFDGQSLIYVKDKRNLGHIIHECSHCIDYCLEYVESRCSEIRARCIEALFNGIMDGLK